MGKMVYVINKGGCLSCGRVKRGRTGNILSLFFFIFF